MGTSDGRARAVSIQQAAEMLRLPVESVDALVGAGYLAPLAPSGDCDLAEVHVALTDLKAFLARNTQPEASRGRAPAADITILLDEPGDLDAEATALLDALSAQIDELADRTYLVLASTLPEAATWPPERRSRFVDHARSRFEALLAIAAQPSPIEHDLLDELTEVGLGVARTGTPLPEVLLTLRISRDLLLQSAVGLAEERGHGGSIALSLLLTRIIPVLDQLTDAVARGYWDALLADQAESWSRFESVVEHATDGVFDVDGDGVLRYANDALAHIAGRPVAELVGRPVQELAVLLGPDIDVGNLIDPANLDQWVEVRTVRADGVERVLLVRARQRQQRGGHVAYAGVVRDVTAERELARQKDDFLALMTEELRRPIATILGLGATLGTYAGELGAERTGRMGRTIHRQAERLVRLADDLFDVSRIESSNLLLSPRVVELRGVIDGAVAMLADEPGIDGLVIRVPAGARVRADARRLEQVVAHLVENALVHGAPPVLVDAAAGDDVVELAVRDHGPGLAPHVEAHLFDRLHPSEGGRRYRDRAGGLGLSLVRGLVEAMGGRVWTETPDEGGACFLIALPPG